MYLIDTNVISELRKKQNANPGVLKFFEMMRDEKLTSYLSVITLGELRRGVEKIRHRGDLVQASLLESWLNTLVSEYEESFIDFDADVAQLWGRLCVPNPENAIDMQIMSTALMHGLKLVTRNIKHFSNFKEHVINPFTD